MSTTSGDDDGAHVLVFPYPSLGHMIPLLDLTLLLLTRGLTVTVLVTPSLLPLLQPLLSTHPSSRIQPLVLSLPDAPTPSRSSSTLVTIIRTTSALSDPIIHWFRSHPSPPVAIISDFFLGWTEHLACQLGLPRVVFWPSGAFTASILHSTWHDQPKNNGSEDGNFLISYPELPNSPVYPWWQMPELYRGFKEGDPDWEFLRDGLLANTVSWGLVFNSFNELERVYINHVKKQTGHDRVWAVGPLLPPHDDVMGLTKRGGSSAVPPHDVMTWLDRKADESVVYVCFGSRTVLTNKQMGALATALECSAKVQFIWCVNARGQGHVASDEGVIPDGFEDRVKGRGLIIRGWAPQVAILRHRAVGVFVTHCGWNSVLEGLAAGVMMLAWPMGADQYTNAKLLVDQLGVAVRVCEGGSQTVPDSAELARLLAESVDGSRPERVRVKEMRDAASEAVKKDGSSSKDLEMFVKQLNELKSKNKAMSL